jgi:MFS family permease
MIQAFGRKANWIISLGGAAITDFIYALYEHPRLQHRFGTWVPIPVIFINMLAFGLGAGPIPWFVIPQMFPPQVRSAATSIGILSNWIFTFAVIVTFPSLSEATHNWGVFLIFAVASFAGIIFGIFYIKDPKPEIRKDDSLGVALYDGINTE